VIKAAARSGCRERIDAWSLTNLQQWLVKTGERPIKLAKSRGLGPRSAPILQNTRNPLAVSE